MGLYLLPLNHFFSCRWFLRNWYGWMNKPVGTITWANKSTELTEHQNTQSAPISMTFPFSASNCVWVNHFSFPEISRISKTALQFHLCHFTFDWEQSNWIIFRLTFIFQYLTLHGVRCAFRLSFIHIYFVFWLRRNCLTWVFRLPCNMHLGHFQCHI